MKALFTICAEDSIRDADSNQISLINIIEEIQGPNFPAMHSGLCFVCLIEKEPSDEKTQYNSSFSVRLNEKVLLSQEIPIDFQQLTRTRFIFKLRGLVIPQVGTLVMDLVIEDPENPLATVRVPVRQQ